MMNTIDKMVIIISKPAYEELKKKGINIDEEIKKGNVEVKNGGSTS